ncbi:MAG: hypothetical protein N3E37_05035, partial [Candidatus Micrarchaeota archaeon]|nr:hypothetical protein [Candidatus Micrarchaeota archaeon]
MIEQSKNGLSINPYYATLVNQADIQSTLTKDTYNYILSTILNESEIECKLVWSIGLGSLIMTHIKTEFMYTVDRNLDVSKICKYVYVTISEDTEPVIRANQYKKDCVVNRDRLEKEIVSLSKEIYEKIVKPSVTQLVEIALNFPNEEEAHVVMGIFP